MADRRPVTLDDLDRDELLHLVRHIGLWRPADLVMAQRDAARDRWRVAWDEYMRLGDAAHEAAMASVAATKALVDACRDPAGDMKAVCRLRRAAVAASAAAGQARDREDRAKAKAERIDRRRAALRALYQELTDAP